MAIKFRCVHCHQKLGIARRKAGTQVRCPTCLQTVTVPEQAEPVSGVRPPTAHAGAAAPPLFEQSDIDDLIRVPVADGAEPLPSPSPVPAAPAHAWSVPLPANYDVEPVSANGTSLTGMPPAGILLTPFRATVLTVVVVLLLGVAFGAGLLVGRSL